MADPAARRRDAIALALAGTDWDTIAASVGYASRDEAIEDVMTVLAADEALPPDLARAEDARRLDRIQRGLWSDAINGDPAAVALALQVFDRRQRLRSAGAGPVEGKVRAWLGGLRLSPAQDIKAAAVIQLARLLDQETDGAKATALARRLHVMVGDIAPAPVQNVGGGVGDAIDGIVDEVARKRAEVMGRDA